MGSDAGFTLPLKPGQAAPPAPPGWMRFDMPGGRGARYLPQRGVTQADPKVSEAAREFQAFSLPIPGGVKAPKGGVVSGGRLQVNPGAFGGRTAFNKELALFRNFNRTYAEFASLKAEADRLSRDKKWSASMKARGNTIAEQAAGLVTRMREGGVMGEAEHKRAVSTVSNPQEKRSLWGLMMTGDFGDKTTAEQRGMAGWEQLEKIFNDTRQKWYDHFATGGTQAGTASKRDGSEDVTKSRVGG